MRLSGHTDTIAAIATPKGHGGIGIVRISGPQAKDVLALLWNGNPPAATFKSHTLYYGPIAHKGEIIDRALVSWMRSPKSFTGEDTVEISGHGGPVIMRRILDACCASGARAAEPGEFTKRAFLNGKIDLVQAEAIADLIASTSDAGLKAAQEHLSGRLSKSIRHIQETVTELRAVVEASIDFPEDDLAFVDGAKASQKLKSIIKEAIDLSNTFDEGRLLREGVRVAIAGRPNAGKSSLLNALSGHDRAIVHREPGTTRDVIEEMVSIDGITFRFRDTAGLRTSYNDVEQIGVDRAREEISLADLVLYIIDAVVGITEEDELILSTISEEKRLVVFNKTDAVFPYHASRVTCHCFISALTNQGLDDLRTKLVEFVHSRAHKECEGAIITNIRHKTALDNATHALEKGLAALNQRESVEFIAHYLRETQDFLGGITGDVTDETLLNEIFSKFCIGK